MNKLLERFTALTPERIAQQQMQEARRLHLEHEAAAEHHAALAAMYLSRITRLQPKESA